MNMETLDELLDRMKQDCQNEIRSKKTSADDGMEQFEEMTEKYTKPSFDDDDER